MKASATSACCRASAGNADEAGAGGEGVDGRDRMQPPGNRGEARVPRERIALVGSDDSSAQ